MYGMYGFGLQTNFSDGLLRLLSSIALVQPCMANGVRISPVSDEATNGKLPKVERDTSSLLEREKRYEIEGWQTDYSFVTASGIRSKILLRKIQTAFKYIPEPVLRQAGMGKATATSYVYGVHTYINMGRYVYVLMSSFVFY